MIANLSKLLFQSQSEEELKALLEALLTPKEILELGNRIEIIRSLAQGQTQREIAQKLGVGIATVNRGAKARADGKTTQLENLL